jgi:RNA polymerase sigma-70 factor (ECF subfamily)
MSSVADPRSTTAHDNAQQEDIELLRQVRAQDEQALAQLYDRYGRLLYTIARRVVGEDALAEEVVQDVFLRFWRGAEQYQPNRGRVAVWLIAMARNRAIDILRSRQHQSRQRENATLADSGHLTDLQHPSPGDERFLREAVQAALATLSDPQRQAIELAYYEGMSQSEIAAQLDTPLGTVKSRIRDGIMRLRQTLSIWVSAETGSDRR